MQLKDCGVGDKVLIEFTITDRHDGYCHIMTPGHSALLMETREIHSRTYTKPREIKVRDKVKVRVTKDIWTEDTYKVVHIDDDQVVLKGFSRIFIRSKEDCKCVD